MPLAIAQDKGFFAQEGAKVELVYTENYLTAASEFSAGQYDALTTTLGGLLSIVAQNPEVQIVLATDESAGGDAVVVQPDIQRPSDLKGKRIGVKLGDSGELFITNLLEANHLTTDDVTLVNVEGESVLARLKSGDIQAGHTWDPFIEQAVKAGQRVLFTSKQTPGLIPSIVIFRSDVVRDRPQDIQAFVRAWFRAVNYWKANPEEGNAIVARVLHLKPEAVVLSGEKLYSEKDNLRLFTSGVTNDSLYYTTKQYADFYIRKGALSTVPDINKLLVPTFVQGVKVE